MIFLNSLRRKEITLCTKKKGKKGGTLGSKREENTDENESCMLKKNMTRVYQRQEKRERERKKRVNVFFIV